ncbi:MAG TPA: divergent polysaccharide deacetylase family protein [Candidatus Acidoferrum sp.]|nr:divergent polysaccharide deacetylase family protein [Candidatus Acidoferrum sp.]
MCLLVMLSALFTACEKKPQPLTGVQVRAITRELVLAARNASSGRAETGMIPERPAGPPPARGRGAAPNPPADLIFVTLPRAKDGSVDDAAPKAILDEMDRVAEVHHLTRIQRANSPGIQRFDFLFAGQRTQSVELVTPIANTSGEHARAASRPRLAIIIDDLGYDREAAETLFQLPYPLTVSVLPHLPLSSVVAEEASRRGYEVLLHMPVESNAGEKAEAVELRAGMSADDAVRMLQGMLDTVPLAIGVNNHQGSLGTADTKLMNAIMPALHERRLFFVDSRTSSASIALEAAHRAGVPAASRDVFLDDVQDAAAIHHQLELAVEDAKLHGQAIAIGHPHPATLQALQEFLPRIQSEGVQIVFASQVVH